MSNSKKRVARGVPVVVLAAAFLGIGGSTAVAADHAGLASKKKPTPVAVEVGDTQGVKGAMTMTVTPASVHAGRIKFTVKNSGTVIHEMVVLKTKVAFDKLPVDAKNKVSEAKSLGEAGSIGKGKTKSVTLKLKPGHYVLVCNVAKHYGLGMRAAFTVT
jgi:uncharacterized cupredoxin-like copper-binding protein